jgi:hypothetical protein
VTSTARRSGDLWLSRSAWRFAEQLRNDGNLTGHEIEKPNLIRNSRRFLSGPFSSGMLPTRRTDLKRDCIDG